MQIPQPISSAVNAMYQDVRQERKVTGGRMEETKVINIAPEQQNITFEWAENITFSPSNTIQNAASDIILCSLEVGRNMIAVGSKDGVITIYDSGTGQKIANLRDHRASICKLALVNHNGKKYLASGSDHGCSSIVLWDTLTWNRKMKIEYHKAAVTAIVDLQDNRSLVSGSYDKAINVYNLNEDGKMMFNLPANRASVTAVILNSNGNKLITCGLDDTLSVHQIIRGANRQVETIFIEREIQNNTMICSIVASVLNPDLVFLGTKDGKVKLINIDRGEAYKIYNVCSNAVIELVAVERQSKPGTPLLMKNYPWWSAGPAASSASRWSTPKAEEWEPNR
jgi:WD40 repeat protein